MSKMNIQAKLDPLVLEDLLRQMQKAQAENDTDKVQDLARKMMAQIGTGEDVQAQLQKQSQEKKEEYKAKEKTRNKVKKKKNQAEKRKLMLEEKVKEANDKMAQMQQKLAQVQAASQSAKANEDAAQPALDKASNQYLQAKNALDQIKEAIPNPTPAQQEAITALTAMLQELDEKLDAMVAPVNKGQALSEVQTQAFESAMEKFSAKFESMM